jgi:hypothetical protein
MNIVLDGGKYNVNLIFIGVDNFWRGLSATGYAITIYISKNLIMKTIGNSVYSLLQVL